MERFFSAAGGFTTMQAASAFAAFGILGAVFLVPALAPHGPAGHAPITPGQMAEFEHSDIDSMTTASITAPAGEGENLEAPKTRVYTVRRSVLTKDVAKPCVLFTSGRREGNC